ncbi:hypothetical protein IL54_0671 [Sphingobium sp. ba1]|nr:hypothetical protein IL54_0671 [Sphingobium sp. ba1]
MPLEFGLYSILIPRMREARPRSRISGNRTCQNLLKSRTIAYRTISMGFAS